MSSAPAWVTSRPIAHRGLHDAGTPENSLGAFEAARDAGLPIELDVHPSVEGEPVVFHDDTLDRMTGQGGRVVDLPWHRLRTRALAGGPERIPHLADVVRCVGGRVPLVVEIKNPDAVGVIERAVLRVLSGYEGEVAVQSFNPYSIAWFRRNAPKIVRGLLAGDLDETDLGALQKFVLRRLLLAPSVRPHYVGYDLRALPFWSPSWLRNLGIPLVAWTVRTESQRARARALADNFIFEAVDPFG